MPKISAGLVEVNSALQTLHVLEGRLSLFQYTECAQRLERYRFAATDLQSFVRPELPNLPTEEQLRTMQDRVIAARREFYNSIAVVYSNKDHD